jgi:hypothetical protein
VTRRGREHERTDEERAQVAAELRRVRESVRGRALLERDPGEVLPGPRPVHVEPQKPLPPGVAGEPAPAPPPRPDAAEVNALWPAAPERAPRGLRGWLGDKLKGLLEPHLSAQRRFNASQVQLDNALLDYLDARLAATHRHYDAVLGGVGRHLGEVDERHMILQEELVAHVHDLVKRIDLVLAEGERGRVSALHALSEIRDRLKTLEERLGE